MRVNHEGLYRYWSKDGLLGWELVVGLHSLQAEVRGPCRIGQGF